MFDREWRQRGRVGAELAQTALESPSDRIAIADLTSRERDVAGLVAQARTNAEIARTLGLSRATAKWHVSQILRKLDLTRRVQLAMYAREHGLLPPE